jgi:hypothetical protein
VLPLLSWIRAPVSYIDLQVVATTLYLSIRQQSPSVMILKMEVLKQ